MNRTSSNKILIIEEDQKVTKQLVEIFHGLYTLIINKEIAQAKSTLANENISVVIAVATSESTPVLDLFEDTSRYYPSIQRVLITGQVSQDYIRLAINKGRIFSYEIKPIVPHRLIITIEKAIEQHILLKRNQILINDLKKRNANLQQTLTKLLQEEQKFKHIFEASPDPIFIIDHEGHIMEGNPQAHLIFNFTRLSHKLRNISSLIEAGDKTAILNYLIEAHTKWKPTIEVAMKTNQDQIKDYEINSFPVLFQGHDIFMVTLRDISMRKEMENKVVQSIIQTEEKERSRFAQELHDGIGPLLSTAKLYLQWYHKPNAKMDKGVIIEKVEETVEETIKNLRELSNNISPNTLTNFGLNTAMQSFIERIKGASSINIHYKSELKERLDNDLEVSLYRFLCESLNNTLKHAEASDVNIHLKETPSQLSLQYLDNGKGFNYQEEIEKSSGSGLINMKTRIQSLGGQLNVSSQIEEGTQILVTFSKNNYQTNYE